MVICSLFNILRPFFPGPTVPLSPIDPAVDLLIKFII